MAEILISVAAKVAEYLVAPIVSPLGYLFNYRSNLDKLEQQVETLGDARGRLQRDVNEAAIQGDEIEDGVQKWLSRTEVIIQTAKELIEDEKAANTSCFNLKLRYQRSRQAKQQSGDIGEIQESRFDRVSYRLPPQGIWSARLRECAALASRASTLNNVMEALRDDDIRMIGVWGMGGVGKTTLAYQVAEKAEADKLFEKVVMALNVSRVPNVTKIQGEIASMLGLKFEEEEESGRAARLSKSLQKNKTVLVILDNIWEELVLENIGIPYGDAHRGCKVLLISRYRGVLYAMDCDEVFRVQRLPDQEALSLFKKTAGDSVEELKSIAILVVRECAGLPVAIVTVAKALKGQSEAEWINALQELRIWDEDNIDGMDLIYQSLRLGYDHLKSEEVKRLFLLCGMLGYGDISMDQLLKYGMGLDLFEHVSSLEQIRNKLVTLIKILKGSSLLLDVEDGDGYEDEWPGVFLGYNDENKPVRMHDVVGDFARAIAAEDPHRFVVIEKALGLEEWQRKEEFRNCSRISLQCRDLRELPERLVCSKLEFFLLNGNGPSLRIPNTFFEETELLKVLDLSAMHLTPLPSSLGFLSNLRTLRVYRCTLQDIALIGELKKLQVLCFASCKIERLPKEFMQLTDLRALDLWDCSHLEVIPQNVISSLSRLEHLCLAKSFTKWGAEGFGSGESNNACLSELNNLPYLKTLCIEIRDPNLLSKDLVFEKLTRYLISVSPVEKYVDYNRSARTLKLCRVNKPCLVDCSSNLFKTVEDLELSDLEDTKHVLYELDTDDFLQLKRLDISRWAGIQYIVDSTKGDPSHSAFPVLDKLFISGLQNMDAVCYGPIPEGSFGKLRSLTVYDCMRLKSFISLPMEQGKDRSVLPEMGSLDSTRDFSSTGSSATQELSRSDVPTPFFNEQVAFPALEYLCMDKLDNVRALWQNQLPVHSFRKLERLQIRSCDSLEEVFDMEGVSSNGRHDVAVHPLRESGLYYQERTGFLTFRNLHSVEVISCPCLKYLFPALVAIELVQLEFLEIVSCGVEEIVANENGDEAQSMILFPKLASLTLTDLGKLRHFYRGMLAWRRPRLKKLKVEYCHNLETLASKVDINPISQSLLLVEKFPFPRLEVLEIFHMENIKKIWQDQLPTMESFGNLKVIRVSHCGNLLSVFPTSVIQGLLQLEKLEIDSCGMKEIFAEEDAIETSNRFIFPKLTDLILKNLKELKSFYTGKYISEWPSLKKLEVCNCDNMEILFQEIGLEGNLDSQVQQSFFLVEKSAFPKLEILEIFQMDNIKKIWHGQLSTIESFGHLKEIRVSHCKNLSSVFPTSIIQGPLQLEILEIDSCGMEEIFVKEDGIEMPSGDMFPKLTCLTLKNLHKLKCFYPRKHISKWASLKKLKVCNSDKVEILFQEIDQEANLYYQVQQPFFLIEKLAFPKLEALEISQMENIKRIWHGQLSTIESFGHLKEIRVSHCKNLSSVFPTSIIQGPLQLEILEIDSCGMEEIFVKEDGIETPAGDIFPKLTYLALKNLKELKHFYLGKHISKWALLKNLEVCNCDKVEILFQEFDQEANLDNQAQQPFFFVEAVAFSSLEDLDISNLDNVEKIWHNEFVADSFGKLKRLSVRSCRKLQNIIPSNMLKRLSSLQILKIVVCNSVEEVFDLESIDSKESHDIPALQLQELHLDHLENLKCVWNKAPQGLLTYQNLKSVQVSHCPSLKVPFPGYVVRSLLQVKEVDINSCGVEEIVAHEDVAKVVTMFLFPEATSLTNSCLKQLERFYLGLHNLEWPMLKTLEVESHESLEKVASKLDKPVEQPIFLCDKVTFPNLEFLNLSLKLEGMQDLHILFGALFNLKILIVENCPFLSSLFSTQFIQCLNNLKKLTVKKCDRLKEVFDLKGLAHGDDEHVEMLSKLEEVSLIDLPQLIDICNNSPPQVLCFQNLKSLQVKQCNSVTYLFSPSMVLGLVQLQDLQIEHCPVLKEIFTVEDRDTDNWPPQVSCFQNLKSLQVKHCESLLYLFPYSVALGLGQLQDLCIEHCSKVKKIIMEDGDVDNRPQQVSSLHNLKFVRVKQCDSLMYLFSPSMALGLVQLQDLCIEDCPAMTEIVTAEDRNFYNQPPLVSCFQNLKSVQVKQCDSLMYLFSSSFALALAQLQDLRIEHCCTMKEIVTAEEGVRDKIIFPQTKRISLLKLPKLATFYLSQNLEKIHMGDSNTAPGVLFNEEVAFPNLEFFHVSGLDNVKKIWHNQLLGDSFSKLKEMKVENCNKLQNLLTSNVLNWLRSLEFLKIDSCGKVKEVFDQEVINVQEDVTDTQLSQLVLDDLQQRLHMCNKVLGKYLCLQNLKVLEVHNCGSMKNIFSPDMALGLVRLEGINEIIGQEDGAEEVIDKIEFPELTSLSLKSLPSLASFYPGSHTLRRVGLGDHGILITVLFYEKVAFPSLVSLHISGLDNINEIWNDKPTANSFSRLVEVKVEDCNKLQKGLPLIVLKWLSSLQFLRIANCGKLKEVFNLDGANIEDDATETQLNKLVLHGLPQLQYIWSRDPYGILTYENLDLVEVLHCLVLEGQFPSCLTRDLSQLEKQLIRSRWKKDLEGKDKGEDFVFPEVTYDKLLNLRKIKGKEVVVVSESDYVGEISEDKPGSSG